jgi:hypothetical protein
MERKEDPYVQMAQGYEFLRALKELGVETELVIYPRGRAILDGEALDRCIWSGISPGSRVKKSQLKIIGALFISWDDAMGRSRTRPSAFVPRICRESER